MSNNIDKAFMAIAQKLNILTQTFGKSDEVMALPNPGTNIHPIIEFVNAENWTIAEEQDYHLAKLLNSIVDKPNVWEDSNPILWDIYEEVLDYNNSETTSDILTKWSDRKQDYNVNVVSADEEGEYRITTINKPVWETVTINEDTFDELIKGAQQDETFSNFFKLIFNQSGESNIRITKLGFEFAELQPNRPWFDETLFQDRKWRLKHNTSIRGKNYLSAANPEKAYDGALPGYPIKFIVVRNVKVEFNVIGGHKEEEKVENALTNGHFFKVGTLLLNGNFKTLDRGKYSIEGFERTTSINNYLKDNYFELFDNNAVELNTNTNSAIFEIIRPGGIQEQLALENRLLNPGTSLNIDIRSGILQNQGNTSFNIHTPSTILNETNLNISNFQSTGDRNLTLEGEQGSVAFFPKVVDIRLANSIFRRNPWEFLSIRATTTITGKITDPNNQPVANAQIVFVNKDKRVMSIQKVETLSNSTFSIDLPKNHAFNYFVSADGYKTQEGVISTSNRKKLNLNIVLEKSSSNTTSRIETRSDIQLMAVVYKKLGTSPNPVSGFVPVDKENIF